MTLHSLATAMIAESDNSAADTLLLALGRDRVDAMVAASGHTDPARVLPLLTTAEAFALKMPDAADLRAPDRHGRWPQPWRPPGRGRARGAACRRRCCRFPQS